MSEIERIFNAEQDRVNDAERNAIIQARDEQYVKHLAGRLLSGGVPLVELTILEPVADLLVDYAYSCRMAGVPESERYLVEKKGIFSGIILGEPVRLTEPIGWSAARKVRTVSHGGQQSDTVESCYLYINAASIIRINGGFGQHNYSTKCLKYEFEVDRISASIGRALVARKIPPLVHPDHKN